jgi:hypothetical protein
VYINEKHRIISVEDEMELSTNTFCDYLVYQDLLVAATLAEEEKGVDDELVQDMFWNLIECPIAAEA